MSIVGISGDQSSPTAHRFRPGARKSCPDIGIAERLALSPDRYSVHPLSFKFQSIMLRPNPAPILAIGRQSIAARSPGRGTCSGWETIAPATPHAYFPPNYTYATIFVATTPRARRSQNRLKRFILTSNPVETHERVIHKHHEIQNLCINYTHRHESQTRISRDMAPTR